MSALYRTPDLEQPSYDVLQRRASYEIRRYEPFLVAQAAMPPGAGAAGDGGGFGTLARCVARLQQKRMRGACVRMRCACVLRCMR